MIDVRREAMQGKSTLHGFSSYVNHPQISLLTNKKWCVIFDMQLVITNQEEKGGFIL